jgi:aspartate/methionine/tyrosine aminotransferase
MFSKRTQWRLQPNRFTVLLEEIRRNGTPILDLTECNPTRCGFRYLSPEILAPLANPRNLLYDPSPKGMLQAREAVVAYYGRRGTHVSPDQIFLTASASESYTFLFRLLCDPQDHFLIPRPSYPLLEFLSDLNDVTLDAYRLVYDQRWQVDLDDLQKKIGAKSRGIVVVHPNNPTGSYVKENELSFLNRVCMENSLALISDEVFLEFAFVNPAPTFAANNGVLTFTLGGCSKMIGLPQMKLGWIIVSGPPSLTQQAISRMEVIADTYLSVSTLAQNALTEWLRRTPAIQEEILQRVMANREFLMNQCSVLHAEGGWYAVLLVEGVDEEKFILSLLDKESMVVHPGYFFDFEPEQSYLVLSLLPSPDIFKQGVERLVRKLNGYNT